MVTSDRGMKKTNREDLPYTLCNCHPYTLCTCHPYSSGRGSGNCSATAKKSKPRLGKEKTISTSLQKSPGLPQILTNNF